jgi:alpha-tubulin suppressor-like RCC1 family protein
VLVVNRLVGTVASAAVGRDHSLAALSAAGALRAWGSNANGQIASSNTADVKDTPRTVTGFTRTILLVGAGWSYSFAVA